MTTEAIRADLIKYSKTHSWVLGPVITKEPKDAPVIYGQLVENGKDPEQEIINWAKPLDGDSERENATELFSIVPKDPRWRSSPFWSSKYPLLSPLSSFEVISYEKLLADTQRR